MANEKRTLEALLKKMEPEISKIFIQVIQDISDEAILKEIIKAIEVADFEAAFRATGFSQAAMGPLLDAIDEVYKQAGEITGESFPRVIQTNAGSFRFLFNVRNTAAEQYMREHSAELVSEITRQARSVVQQAIAEGMGRGDNPRMTALNIVGRVDPVTKQRVGGVLGLTQAQMGWVNSMELDLRNLDANYFKRSLRDARFDSTVRAAIESGKPLPSETVQKLLTAYKTRILKYRGDTIGITETLTGIAAAKRQAHVQLVDDGLVPQEAIRRFWDSSGQDGRTRFTHLALERKYKLNGVAMNEPYVSPSGAKLMYPHDVSLGAPSDEVIRCRCIEEYRVDWTFALDG